MRRLRLTRVIRRGARRVQDEEILEFIKEDGICFSKRLKDRFGFSDEGLVYRMALLQRAGVVHKFQIERVGGGFKRNLSKLFGPYHQKVCYYVDEDAAAKKLLADLNIKDADKGAKHQMTTYLRNCVPRSLFVKLYRAYASKDAIRSARVTGVYLR
jgi:hypothetical protein